jgi:hypothetical protein
MDDTYIVTVFVMLDDTLKTMQYSDDSRAQVKASEILTVAVLAAKYFGNRHEQALMVLQRLGDIRRISLSRFNRRLHALREWVSLILEWLPHQWSTQALFIVDSMPLPACKRVRAKRCKKAHGPAFWGYCAAKDEYYFGWKVHLICDIQGLPITFDILPAACHEFMPLQHLLAELPAQSWVLADKGYNSAAHEQAAYGLNQIRLIPKRRRNMSPNDTQDAVLLRRYRSVIETVNSQLEKMALQHLYARTADGFGLKVFAALLALFFTNLL